MGFYRDTAAESWRHCIPSDLTGGGATWNTEPNDGLAILGASVMVGRSCSTRPTGR
jgi:hypothetical protein